MPGQRQENPEGYDGMDALMAAITGDPLPEEARADPVRAAAHRSATTDVALLREQLGLIAEALTRPAEEPAPAAVRPLRRPRTRPRAFALRAVGVAAAGALVLGAGWLVTSVETGGIGVESSSDSAAKAASGAEQQAGSPLADPGYLACAELIAEGDVTAVRPVPGSGEERVTLRVTRSYTPRDDGARGKEVGFVLGEDMDPLVTEGDHVLVALSAGSSSPDVWTVGEDEIAAQRAVLVPALDRARGLACE